MLNRPTERLIFIFHLIDDIEICTGKTNEYVFRLIIVNITSEPLYEGFSLSAVFSLVNGTSNCTMNRLEIQYKQYYEIKRFHSHLSYVQ